MAVTNLVGSVLVPFTAFMARINDMSENRKFDTAVRRMQFNVFRFLETRKTAKSRHYQRLIVVMIIASLALGIINTVDGYDVPLVITSRIALETLLLIIFLTEYILRIWSSGAHGTYGAAGGWKKYLVTPHMVIDAFVILSSLSLIIASQFPLSISEKRLIYLLQLTRILRIDRQRGAFKAFWRVFKKHSKELLTCWYMGFLMVTFVSFLVYALEQRNNSKARTLDNLFNGVYWGVISLTTIGYGDINPESTSSKILICCFAVFGTCFLAMPAGIIGSGFALQVAEQQKEKHVNRRRRPAAILIQSFWRKYAADHDLPKTWKPHIKGRQDKYNKMKSLKSATKAELLGVPFIPVKSGKSPNDSPFEQSDSQIFHESMCNNNNSSALWYPRKELTVPEKIALRFVRFLKCISSTKKFRQARRPYDERDILDQFASSQIEMFAKLRELRTRVDSNSISSEHKVNEASNQVKILEKSVRNLETQLKENNELLRLIIEKEHKTKAEENKHGESMIIIESDT